MGFKIVNRPKLHPKWDEHLNKMWGWPAKRKIEYQKRTKKKISGYLQYSIHAANSLGHVSFDSHFLFSFVLNTSQHPGSVCILNLCMLLRNNFGWYVLMLLRLILIYWRFFFLKDANEYHLGHTDQQHSDKQYCNYATWIKIWTGISYQMWWFRSWSISCFYFWGK